jgi:hypothetical protein
VSEPRQRANAAEALTTTVCKETIMATSNDTTQELYDLNGRLGRLLEHVRLAEAQLYQWALTDGDREQQAAVIVLRDALATGERLLSDYEGVQLQLARPKAA